MVLGMSTVLWRMASQSPSDTSDADRIWHKALDRDELPGGRVIDVTEED